MGHSPSCKALLCDRVAIRADMHELPLVHLASATIARRRPRPLIAISRVAPK